MEVRMTHEVLSPGMEDTDNSYHCPKTFRVLCEFRERFGDRTEKEVVQDLAVHGDQGVKFGGEGEDHMEIGNGQEILTAGLDPLLFP
jgi:hypothetical protein